MNAHSTAPTTLAKSLMRRSLTRDDRALMHGVEIHLRAVFGGWEASVVEVETDIEIGHTPVQDTTVAALIVGDAIWFEELESRRQGEREFYATGAEQREEA